MDFLNKSLNPKKNKRIDKPDYIKMKHFFFNKSDNEQS